MFYFFHHIIIIYTLNVKDAFRKSISLPSSLLSYFFSVGCVCNRHSKYFDPHFVTEV